MTKIAFFSDAHYGLKSAGFDRTEEIHGICKDIVQHSIHSGADYLVFGGDLGHRSSPDPRVHGLWVELYEELEKNKLKSFFMLGNHDVTYDKHRPYGSLSPLEALNYDYVKVMWTGDRLKLTEKTKHLKHNLFFLPYFNPASISSNHNDHYEKFVETHLARVPEDGIVVAFTHLNIPNAFTDGDHILRPVNAVIPQRLIDDPRVKLIVSGHIHKAQELYDNKLVVVGSPICTDFGDIGDKSYLEIVIKDDGVTWKRIPTNHIRLIELEYDLTVGHELNFIKSSVEGCGVKVKVRGTKDQIQSANLEQFEEDLKGYAKFVRPITPTVVRMNSEKKSLVKQGMSDEELISKWIETKSPSDSETVLKTALNIIEEVR